MEIFNARNNLGKVVRRAHLNNESFILEKDGIPLAALINFNDFEDYLETQDPILNKKIKQSYLEYLNGKARPIEEFLVELSKPVIPKKK